MHTRRHFIKAVMMGATAAGMPGCGSGPGQDATAPGTTAPAPPHAATRLHGDHFETCHAVRDGERLPVAEVKASHDVVIVGGGPSGLSAAHALRGRDLLLLEKEEVFGGNCILEEWEGVRYSTGGAFYTESEKELVAFSRRSGPRD